MNEQTLMERIRRMAAGGRGLELGIGDDCAIFRARAGEDLLFTTDQMIEGVHFRRSLKPEMIGERALARSLSDIAAMGGEPRFCLVTLAVPADQKWIEAFSRRPRRLAQRTGPALAGGRRAPSRKEHRGVAAVRATPPTRAPRRG